MQQRDVTLVLGQTGSGKSFYANQYAMTKPRVLIATAGYKDFNVPYADSYQSLLTSLSEHAAFGTYRPFRIGYDFLPDEYDLIFEVAKELRNVLLVLEEADRFAVKELPGYQHVIYRGRHDMIELLGLSLSPKDLPKDYRRQATRLISFRQTDPDDVDYVASIAGKESALKLPTLSGPPAKPPHDYLLWTPLEGGRIIPRGNFVTGP